MPRIGGRWGFSLIAIVVLSARAEEQKSFTELMAAAERYWLNDDYVQSNRVLEEAIQLYPQQAEPYWRKARNLFDLVEILPREQKPAKTELLMIYREVETLGQKCMELSPADGNCPFWKAVGMGRRASTQGILSTLSELKEFEGLVKKSLELKPAYRAEGGKAAPIADAYAILGQLYRLLPDWQILAWLFGTQGDLDQSIIMLRRAVALEPQRIEHVKELGVSLLCRGQKQGRPEDITEGRELLHGIDLMPIIKPSDKVDKTHARMLLHEPSLACGYSRDAQQELSREAWEKGLPRR